jgi:signal transduction histidine kinase/putative methionine-R-sulfoxide reductase with GAF domain
VWSFRDVTERKRAEERLAQRAAQLTLLADTGRQIAAVTDLNTVLERAAHLVQERFGYHHAALFTLDRETGELVMRARSGKFAHLFPLDHRLKLGQGMVGWVGSHGETLLANDVDAEPRYVNLYPGVVPTKAELSVPIRVGQEIVGVLDVQSDRPHAFSENDVMVMETLADQIAVAIENARLYERVRAGEESERRFREQVAALHEVSIELSKAPTFDDLCRQAVELGRSRLGFDRLGIWFLDQDRQFLVGSFGTDEKGQLRDERGSRLPIAIQEASMAVLNNRVSLVFEPDEPLRDGTGVIVGRGWLAIVAIRDTDKVIGYISADNLLHGLPADEHQLEILKLYGITLGHLCTRKRAEEALAQKAQELARSNADLQHFAYIASHDLQEPLRMVTSYLQLLERRYKEQLDADARDFIAYAVDGASRMQNLISALLSYSRVGTRGKPFAPTDCSMVLERALDNLKVAIKESNAVVTHDPLPTVMADDVQLTQVFQTLIGNAVKFHGERPPQVHVGAQHGEGEWIFSVRDNGIGIDPRHFERIFMIFQRLHSQDEYPGAGIGLAICKRIVERHGGRIWVESQPGKGSTFYFAIPDRGGTS